MSLVKWSGWASCPPHKKISRYQDLPGNADPEALPRIFMEPREAEPLAIGSQAEPRNQLFL